MCVPGIILLALFAYLPMFGLVLAFKNYKFNLGIFGSEWVGFKNFEFFFTSGTFGRLIRNTLGLNLLFLLCNTVITVLLALLLYEINSRHAIKAFQTVIFLPFIVSWVAASYALYANLADVNGIVNGILTFFGKETVSWYTTPNGGPTFCLSAICGRTWATALLFITEICCRSTNPILKRRSSTAQRAGRSCGRSRIRSSVQS